MTLLSADLLKKILGVAAILMLLIAPACTDNAPETKKAEEKASPVKKQKPVATITYAGELGETPAGVWPDPDLEKAFAQYWANRFSGTPKEGFAMEAPHFQDMVSEGLYTRYTKNARVNKLVSVQILGIDYEGEHLCAVKCKLLLELPDGKRDETGVRDRWVLVGDKWYHVIKNRLFFPI